MLPIKYFLNIFEYELNLPFGYLHVLLLCTCHKLIKLIVPIIIINKIINYQLTNNRSYRNLFIGVPI